MKLVGMVEIPTLRRKSHADEHPKTKEIAQDGEGKIKGAPIYRYTKVMVKHDHRCREGKDDKSHKDEGVKCLCPLVAVRQPLGDKAGGKEQGTLKPSPGPTKIGSSCRPKLKTSDNPRPGDQN